MFLPLAESGIPMATVASGIRFSFNAAVPIRYIILLSMLSRLAVFTAEPKAIPRSKALNKHVGPIKSWPVFFWVFFEFSACLVAACSTVDSYAFTSPNSY